jgi:fluoroquinolone resistance protein
LAKLQDTAFRDITFTNCKLLGLRFNDCNSFSLAFDFKNCVLNFASFYKLKLKNVRFEDCKLEETDFVETDLSKAVFKNCELKRASFSQTILDDADLRTAFNFSIDPENNRIKKAKFSTHNIVGLLDKYNIIIE